MFAWEGCGDNFSKSSVVICESRLGQAIIQVHFHRYKYFISLVWRVVSNKKTINVWICISGQYIFKIPESPTQGIVFFNSGNCSSSKFYR